MMQTGSFLMLMMLQFGVFHVLGLKKKQKLKNKASVTQPRSPASAHMAQSWTTGNAWLGTPEEGVDACLQFQGND